MPNWCNNRTNISGTEKQITTLLRAATVTDEHNSQSIRLANLVPMPDILDGTISPTPTGEFDSSKYDEWVNDPTNEHWTAERVEEARIRHNEAVALAEQAHAETGYQNWWDWQLANWGIKWGDCDTIIQDELFDNENDNTVNVTLVYQTPWGPFSDKFFENISGLFGGLTISNVYEEPGMCFAGGNTYHNGKTTSSIETNYDMPEVPEGDDVDWDAYYEEAHEIREKIMDHIEATI